MQKKDNKPTYNNLSTNNFHYAKQILSIKENPATLPVINGHNQAGWENSHRFTFHFKF